MTPKGAGSMTVDSLGRTTTPYTLNTALQDLGQNAGELDKPKFEQALQTLTDTLRDATPQLRGALDGVADLSRSLNKRDEALEQLLAHAKKVSDTLAQRAGQVNQLVTDGNLLFAALDEKRQALSNLIGGIQGVSEQLSGFVADNKREFGPALQKLNAVLDNLLERRITSARRCADCRRMRPRSARSSARVPASRSTCTACRPRRCPRCCSTRTSSRASCRTAWRTTCAGSSPSDDH